MSIGFVPTRDTLYLSTGVDFIHYIDAPAGSPYPSGFTARILVQARDGTTIATWSASTTSTSSVGWKIQSDTTTTGVDAVIAAGAAKFKLIATFPPSPTDDYLWFYGLVKIQ